MEPEASCPLDKNCTYTHTQIPAAVDFMEDYSIPEGAAIYVFRASLLYETQRCSPDEYHMEARKSNTF